MTSCPKCGFDLAAESVDCPSCGLVLAKYRASLPPTPTAEGASVAAEPAARIEAPWPPLPRSDTKASPPISPATIDALVKARPWIRFLAGYGFVMLTLVTLASLALIVLSTMNPRMFPIAVAYLFYGFIGFSVLIPLHRSADALGQVALHPNAAIESFAAHQRDFWRRLGVLTAVFLVLGLVGILFALSLGALATLRQ